MVRFPRSGASVPVVSGLLSPFRGEVPHPGAWESVWGKEKQRKAMTLARCLMAWAHTWVGWLCVLFSLPASPLSLMQNLPQGTISVPAWVALRTKSWSALCQDVRTWRWTHSFLKGRPRKEGVSSYISPGLFASHRFIFCMESVTHHP